MDSDRDRWEITQVARMTAMGALLNALVKRHPNKQEVLDLYRRILDDAVRVAQEEPFPSSLDYVAALRAEAATLTEGLE